MDVKFYTFSKKRNSTKRPEDADASYVCVLKNNTSMLAPELELRRAEKSAPLYNYCYIETFRRYYFVEWENESATLWVAHCTEDVLATFRASIGASTKYILRCASSAYWDGSIIDNMYPATTEVAEVSTAATDSPYENWVLVLGILGAPTSTGSSFMTASGVQYYALNYEQAKGLFRYLLGATENPEDLTPFEEFIFNAFKQVDEWGRLTFQYSQYITSAMWMPFDATALGSASTEMQFGKFKIIQNCTPISSLSVWESNAYTIPIEQHPQSATRGTYLNSEPYTSYYLQIEPFGIIHLDSALLNDATSISFKILCDIATGQARLEYWANVPNKPAKFLRTCWSQLGVSLQLAHETNWLRTIYENKVAIGTSGTWLGALTSVGNALLNPPILMDSDGVNGAIAGLLVDYPTLHQKYYTIVNPDDADNGRPCCKNLQINTLSGYVLCDSGEINVLTSTEAPPTESELSQISSFLTGGFYYE